MWKERLKRIFLVTMAGVFLMLAGKVLTDWQATRAVEGKSIELPTQLVIDKLEKVGQDVLGRAVEILPGSSQVKEKIIQKEAQTTQVVGTETTKIIETQTNEIIEIIKQLPQSQFDQIKKQVFKDFCEQVLKE